MIFARPYPAAADSIAGLVRAYVAVTAEDAAAAVDPAAAAVARATAPAEKSATARNVLEVWRRRLTPGCPQVDFACFQRLKLKYDELLSNLAFILKLRPSLEALAAHVEMRPAEPGPWWALALALTGREGGELTLPVLPFFRLSEQVNLGRDNVSGGYRYTTA